MLDINFKWTYVATGNEECLVCKRHLDKINKMYRDAEVMTLPDEIVEKDSIDAEVQNIINNEKSKMLHRCPMEDCGYSNAIIDDLAVHVLSHFPPVKIKDDNFDQFYVEQSPSII